eukprot:m.233680 g.233680  ORF g.233680 m.233680 type:complete len:106 (+) comp17083_c0_seq22:1182-1499(+)
MAAHHLGLLPEQRIPSVSVKLYLPPPATDGVQPKQQKEEKNASHLVVCMEGPRSQCTSTPLEPGLVVAFDTDTIMHGIQVALLCCRSFLHLKNRMMYLCTRVISH